jgi:hypothetical protein
MTANWSQSPLKTQQWIEILVASVGVHPWDAIRKSLIGVRRKFQGLIKPHVSVVKPDTSLMDSFIREENNKLNIILFVYIQEL